MKSNCVPSLFLRSLLAAIIFLAAGFTSSAQAPAAVDTLQGAKVSIWKIKGEKATVYLAGSMHLLTKDEYPLAQPYNDAFQDADVVVFEVPMDKIADPAAQMQLMQMGMYKDDRTLKSELSESTYKALIEAMNKAGLGPALIMMEKMQPAIVGMALSVAEMMKLGALPQYGLDMHFYQRATEEEKETAAFESIEFQMKLLTGFTKEQGEKMVKMTLKDLAETKTQFKEMVRAWRTGDTDEIVKFFDETDNELFPEFKDLFLTKRNKAWIPKIEKLIAGDKDALVVVGLGHLAGKDSVIDLLEKKGHKITQISAPGVVKK